MPFKSQAQRGFMYSQHPKLAKEFEAATPKGAKLPEHVSMSEGGMACMHCGGEVGDDGYSMDLGKSEDSEMNDDGSVDTNSGNDGTAGFEGEQRSPNEPIEPEQYTSQEQMRKEAFAHAIRSRRSR